MNASLLRVFWSLLVHIAVLAFACLVLYFLGNGQDALAEATRTQYRDRPDFLEDVRLDVVWGVINWCLYSIAVSWIIASIWLLVAERHRPTTQAEGAGKLGLWVLGLILALTAMVVIGWSTLWRSALQLDMAAGSLTVSMFVVGLSTFLAYYLGTALTVKRTMRPSVPMARIFPNLSKASS